MAALACQLQFRCFWILFLSFLLPCLLGLPYLHAARRITVANQNFFNPLLVLSLQLDFAFFYCAAAGQRRLKLFCQFLQINLLCVYAFNDCVVLVEFFPLNIDQYLLALFCYGFAYTKLFHQATYGAYFAHSFLLPPFVFSFLTVKIFAIVLFISLSLPGFFGIVPVATWEFAFISSFLSSDSLFSSSSSLVSLSSFAFIFFLPFFPWRFFFFSIFLLCAICRFLPF